MGVSIVTWTKLHLQPLAGLPSQHLKHSPHPAHCLKLTFKFAHVLPPLQTVQTQETRTFMGLCLDALAGVPSREPPACAPAPAVPPPPPLSLVPPRAGPAWPADGGGAPLAAGATPAGPKLPFGKPCSANIFSCMW